MKDIIDIINHLPGMVHLTPATSEQVAEAERVLGVLFSEEFKTYLTYFGAVSAEGIELTGSSSSKRLSVVATTLRVREDAQLPSEFYVIENLDIEESVAVQRADGRVFQYARMTELIEVAASLSEYISQRA